MSLYRQTAQKIRKIFAIVLYHKFRFFQHKFFIAICVNISIHFVHGIKTAHSLPADGIQAASTVPLILGSENRSMENRSPELLPMSSFSKQGIIFYLTPCRTPFGSEISLITMSDPMSTGHLGINTSESYYPYSISFRQKRIETPSADIQTLTRTKK